MSSNHRGSQAESVRGWRRSGCRHDFAGVQDLGELTALYVIDAYVRCTFCFMVNSGPSSVCFGRESTTSMQLILTN